jgi:hypothetical protein
VKVYIMPHLLPPRMAPCKGDLRDRVGNLVAAVAVAAVAATVAEEYYRDAERAP